MVHGVSPSRARAVGSSEPPRTGQNAQVDGRPFLVRGQSSERRRLTPRERQCVEMAYFTNREIAAQLGNRPSTVKALLRGAMCKLGAENRTHALLVLERMERTAA